MLIPMMVFSAACAGLAYFGLHKSSDSKPKERNKDQMDLFRDEQSAQNRT
jgi:hypothetical protein